MSSNPPPSGGATLNPKVSFRAIFSNPETYVGIVFVILLLVPGLVFRQQDQWSPCQFQGDKAVDPNLTFQPAINPQMQAIGQRLGADAIYDASVTDCLSRVNKQFDIWVKFAVVAAALVTTFSSGINWRPLGVFSGAVAAGLVALQTFFPFADRGPFYGQLSVLTQRLQFDLEMGSLFAGTDELARDLITREQTKLWSVESAMADGHAAPEATATPQPSPTSPAAAPSAPPAGWVYGFHALREFLGDRMGERAGPEWDAGDGDRNQITTTGGMAYWRSSTNIAAFTDGYQHWAVTDRGIELWLGSSIDPGEDAVVVKEKESPTLTAQSP
jgi:hypothetical protein